MEAQGVKRTADVAEGKVAVAQSSFPELLRFYYGRLFPYRKMFQWLRYEDDMGTDGYFAKREFSFTLEGDIYLRYKSFKDDKELKAEIQKLQPIKIDIGAIYNYEPKKRKAVESSVFQPKFKEFVFDIDMTDYDEVRTCCRGTAVCKKCWRFMTIAIQILDRALREDFGFNFLFWVFSGRRGVHCWVADKRARDMSHEARAAIAENLQIILGGADKSKKVSFYLGPKGMRLLLNPAIQRALDEVIQPHFGLIVEEQQLLDIPEKYENILELIPDDDIRGSIKAFLEGEGRGLPGREKWSAVQQRIQEGDRLVSKVAYEIMFQYCYPRLDIEVSKTTHHLLKSPWCVHPKTGKVCVPIDPANAEDFDPDDVPTLTSLEREINEFDAQNPDKNLSDYKKTSLKAHLDYWEDSFLSPLHSDIRSNRAENMDGLSF